MSGNGTSKIGLPAGRTGQPSKIGSASTAPGQADVPTLNANQADTLSQYFTYLTKADGQTYILYNGDRRWAKITLTLQSTGPVAVGDSSTLGVVTSGTGVLLQTNTPLYFTVGKGTKLYIAATAVSRVNVFVEPIPWLEQIAAFASNIAKYVKALATGRLPS